MRTRLLMLAALTVVVISVSFITVAILQNERNLQDQKTKDEWRQLRADWFSSNSINQTETCPDEINQIYDSRRRIVSCGANPPQSEFSILGMEGINRCQIEHNSYYYMNPGGKASITYIYEVTENRQNSDELFDLQKDPQFLCKVENSGYQTCVPEGIDVAFEFDKRFIAVNDPRVITANIKVNEDASPQHMLLRLTPNICTNPQLVFNILD